MIYVICNTGLYCVIIYHNMMLGLYVIQAILYYMIYVMLYVIQADILLYNITVSFIF